MKDWVKISPSPLKSAHETETDLEYYNTNLRNMRCSRARGNESEVWKSFQVTRVWTEVWEVEACTAVQSAQRRKIRWSSRSTFDPKKHEVAMRWLTRIRLAREKVKLPKSPPPVRPFRIRYMAQDSGPELENAPGFMPSKIPGEARQQRPVSKQQESNRKLLNC